MGRDMLPSYGSAIPVHISHLKSGLVWYGALNAEELEEIWPDQEHHLVHDLYAWQTHNQVRLGD